jgi:ribosomal protein S18 acetylase RimI-like enzyme
MERWGGTVEGAVSLYMEFEMIEYLYTAEDIEPNQLQGFFVGWPNPPTPETHLRLLRNSDRIVVAIDTTNNIVVGFITAITDKVLAAYIPLLEVLPEYQKQKIGTTLVKKMLEQLKEFYAVDLLCDEDLQPYYEHLGMRRATGMFRRNYDRQSGT